MKDLLFCALTGIIALLLSTSTAIALLYPIWMAVRPETNCFVTVIIMAIQTGLALLIRKTGELKEVNMFSYVLLYSFFITLIIFVAK